MFERLSPRQRELIGEWMPGAEVVADLSWGIVDTVVLHVRHGGRELVVKAGGERDHHIGRELDSHEGGWVEAWAAAGRAARLVHADRGERILVLERLPGELAYRTPAATDPEVHRQAGVLLRGFHAQHSRPGDRDDLGVARALRWLDGRHRIDPDAAASLRALFEAASRISVDLVPTHGDWQPRNWLVDDGVVRIIDFGRFALRPAASDFARLAAQEWREAPACETAFFEGYGSDPREPSAWRLLRAAEAVGTAAWAFQVGDEAFEAQGHRMIADVLAG